MSKSASRKEQLTSGQAQLLRNDRILFFILLAHLPFTMLVIPLGYGTQGFAIYASSMVGFAAVALYLLLRGTPIFGILAGILLMTLSAIMIQSQLGRTEMHFHVFVALAMLIIYRSWVCIIAPATLITVHHLILTYVQSSGGGMDGTPIMLYSYGCTWDIALVHIGFIVLEAGILAYHAILMKRDAAVSEMLMEAISSIERDSDLRVRVASADRSEGAAALNGLTRKLAKLMADVAGSAEKINLVSRELVALARPAELESPSRQDRSGPASTRVRQRPPTLEQIAQGIQGVSDLGATIDEKAAEGHEQFNRAVRSTMDLQEIMGDAADSIERLKESAAGMGTVIDVIASISGQADTLAGRAEGSETPDVPSLANEAGELARLTRDCTKDIRQIVQRLQKEIKDSAFKMDYGQQKTTETSSEILQAGMALNEILESVSEISEMCTEIPRSLGQRTGASQGYAGISGFQTDGAGQDQQDLEATLSRKATRLRQVADTLSRLASAYRY